MNCFSLVFPALFFFFLLLNELSHEIRNTEHDIGGLSLAFIELYILHPSSVLCVLACSEGRKEAEGIGHALLLLLLLLLRWQDESWELRE